jgi:hypothetical protein
MKIKWCSTKEALHLPPFLRGKLDIRIEKSQLAPALHETFVRLGKKLHNLLKSAQQLPSNVIEALIKFSNDTETEPISI